MVCKRGYDVDEESYEIAPKHRRQEDDHTAQLSPNLENDPCNDGSQRLSSDGEGENSSGESQDEGKVSKDMVNESLHRVNSASQYDPFGSISSYWWFDSNLSDQFSDLNGALHLSCFPNYFELDGRAKASVQPEEIYTTMTDHSPRKGVPVGPEYQADVPEWSPQDSKNYVSGNVVGTCVIPMPDLESYFFNCELNDQIDRETTCTDGGSIDHVRQHVLKARNALRENFGQNVFEELGFCDMGEEVAKKWSEGEQQAFHEVVFSNTFSSGKNFWDHLPYVFPSKTKRDLVSYYFNVFMLRIRAEQNRYDPLNIDSDDDEWQGSERGTGEEGEDSVVESLPSQDAPCNQENLDEVSDNEVESKYTSFLESSCKMSNNYKEDQDIQDYLSTFYEDRNEPVNLEKSRKSSE